MRKSFPAHRPQNPLKEIGMVERKVKAIDLAKLIIMYLARDNTEVNSDSYDSDIERTMKAFSVALKSASYSKSTDPIKCEFCDLVGHSEDRCLLKPQNPNH